ncbi:MAG: hypothetical protein M1818_006694 [Claussenomyces sp. TS43310]|nr:MAG: hypothetical protein M1818_006694 [Claussenomyces sp. TS43310]
MSETPTTVSSEASSPPSSAAEQARIRKERREAKIRAGGSARLNKITGLGGGIQRDAPTQPSVPQPASVNPAEDPEEVDISQHFYQPASTPRDRIPPFAPSRAADQITDDQLRAMMLGNALPAQGQQQAGPNPFAGFPGLDGMGPGGPPGADDPMMKMLQQLMGGVPGEGADGMPSFPGMPPMGMPGQEAAPADPYAYLWRIVHAVFALALGCYMAVSTTFTGTKLERDLSSLSSATLTGGSIRFFYIFATFEALLQTSRFFLEKGRVQQVGILGIALGFLPEPWKGYLELVLRYARIWTTISADAMVCIFVLGICSWWKLA